MRSARRRQWGQTAFRRHFQLSPQVGSEAPHVRIAGLPLAKATDGLRRRCILQSRHPPDIEPLNRLTEIGLGRPQQQVVAIVHQHEGVNLDAKLFRQCREHSREIPADPAHRKTTTPADCRELSRVTPLPHLNYSDFTPTVGSGADQMTPRAGLVRCD